MKILFLAVIVSFVVAALWNSLSIIKTSVHGALDPSLGRLLDWNITTGFILIVGIVMLISTILQKYLTDQKALKEIKEEQKKLQELMKQHENQPEKKMEFVQKSTQLALQAMPLAMRPILYTAIPFILLFRWFGDYFLVHPTKILGMSWFLVYIILSVIFSSVYRKALKVH